MKMKLLADRIAVVPLTATLTRIGSIALPETIKKGRATQGIVKYRGPTTKHIRVGDHVVFHAYVGSKFSLEGEGDLIVMFEDSVDAIIENGDDRVLPISLIREVLRDMEVDPHLFEKSLHARSVANMEF